MFGQSPVDDVVAVPNVEIPANIVSPSGTVTPGTVLETPTVKVESVTQTPSGPIVEVSKIGLVDTVITKVRDNFLVAGAVAVGLYLWTTKSKGRRRR